MRFLSFLLAVSLFTTTARAAGWKLYEDGNGDRRAAACTVPGIGPQGPVTATLVVHHPRGMPLKIIKKGDVTELHIAIELCVDHYESVKGFDFMPFEGPDATAADKRLVSITVEAGKEHFSKRFRQAGWINQLDWLLHSQSAAKAGSATGPEAFTFGVGDAIGDLKDYVTITKLLQQSPTKIEVTVTDSKDPKRMLHFTFPTDNAAEVIGKLMR